MKDHNKNRPGYKKTKVGWVPKSWRMSFLRDICGKPVSGYSAVRADCHVQQGNYAVLKLSCIQAGRFFPNENKLVADHELANLKTPVRKNTLLVSRSNTEELVGAVCYVDRDAPNLFLSDLMWEVSANNDTTINLKWLTYLLCTTPYRKQIVARAHGTSGSMKKINKNSFLGVRVSLPPLPEQQKIAEILSTWDKAIEQMRKLIDAKKSRKKALMQQLLTGKTRLPKFNKPWKEYKLSQLLQSINDRSIKTSTLPLYSLTIESGVTPKTDRYNREALVKDKDKKLYKKVYPNDMVFNPSNLRWGAIDRNKESFPVLISPIYEVLRIKDGFVCHPIFLSEMLSSQNYIRMFASRVEGTLVERMAVKLNAFLTTRVNIPSDTFEQGKISEVLLAADNEIQTLENKLAALEKQKRGLMQKLLTGEVRVSL